LPGFPFMAFLVLALALGGLYALKKYEAKKAAGQNKGKVSVNAAESTPGSGKPVEIDLDDKDDVERYLTATTPLILLCSDRQQQQIEQLRLSSSIRQRFFIDFGVKLPELGLQFSPHVAENQVTVLLNEVKAAQYSIVFDLLCLVNDPSELLQMNVPLQMEDGRTGQKAAWISAEEFERVKSLGYVARSAADELYHHLTGLFSRAINEFFGVQETKNLMDQLEARFPDLVKEAYRHATVQRIAEVLQRLIQEKISIRNMKMILEALAQWAPREKDVIALVECVRGALSRYISQKFSLSDELRVVVLSPDVEETIRQGVRQSAGGVFLNLDPADSEQIIDRLAVGLETISIAQKDLVLVASVDIRRFVKRLIESRFDELEVLSFAEISDSVNVNVIKTI